MIRRIDWLAPKVRARKPQLPHPRPANQIPHDMVIFAYFLRLAGRGCGFRARNRALTFSARQSILLIMEMILHTLIAIVALKAMNIHEFEG